MTDFGCGEQVCRTVGTGCDACRLPSSGPYYARSSDSSATGPGNLLGWGLSRTPYGNDGPLRSQPRGADEQGPSDRVEESFLAGQLTRQQTPTTR